MSRYIPTKFAPKLYSDWYSLIAKLPAEKQAEVIRAIFQYPDFTPSGVDCWDFLASRLDDQYQVFLKRKVERTEAAKKGAEARWGKKDDDSEIPNRRTTDSKIESVSRFAELAGDDSDILDALRYADSGLSVFLATGEGYEDALSRTEREFVDRGDVRNICDWHKKLQAPKLKPIHDENFERFWANFPGQRKCDKGKCLIKFRVIVKGGVDPELLIQKAADYSKTDEVKRKYAAIPMTWLNQSQWELDYSAAAQSKNKKTEVPL